MIRNVSALRSQIWCIVMLDVIKAIGYTLCHPFDTFDVTVVRRYVDAQGHYIGELYDGGKMIGYSCDNLSLVGPLSKATLCWSKSFLDILPPNTIRVGALEPRDNANVQAYVAIRRWLPFRVTILNRFVEHVMEHKI